MSIFISCELQRDLYKKTLCLCAFATMNLRVTFNQFAFVKASTISCYRIFFTSRYFLLRKPKSIYLCLKFEGSFFKFTILLRGGGKILWLNNESEALSNLKKRIDLCSRGVTMPEESDSTLHFQSNVGFAGPQGTCCYVGDAPGDHSSQISLSIFPKDHYLAQYALSSEWHKNKESDESDTTDGKILYVHNDIYLKKVPVNWKGILSNGRKSNILSKKRFHPYGTFCIGNYWYCRHIEQDNGCKYCTINLSIEKLKLSKWTRDEDNLNYLKLAVSQNPIRSVTLTSGTFESPERTGRELLTLARLIREEVDLTVHIQIEPVFDRILLKELSEVADSIGIFLEFFDENVRQKICPGKTHANSQEDYRKCWEMAVSFFGWGKVVTSNIIGFDEDYEVILKGVERAAKIGVVSTIQWLRVGSPSLGNIVPSYIGKEDKVLEFHQEVGKILVENSVDNISLKNAGCLGCLGCQATREAVKWARIASVKIKSKLFRQLSGPNFAQPGL